MSTALRIKKLLEPLGRSHSRFARPAIDLSRRTMNLIEINMRRRPSTSLRLDLRCASALQ